MTSRLRAGAAMGSSHRFCTLGGEWEGETFVQACVEFRVVVPLTIPTDHSEEEIDKGGGHVHVYLGKLYISLTLFM